MDEVSVWRKIFLAISIVVIIGIFVIPSTATMTMKNDGYYRILEPVQAYTAWSQGSGSFNPQLCSNACLTDTNCKAVTYIFLPNWPSGGCYLYNTLSYQKQTTGLLAGSTYITYIKKYENTDQPIARISYSFLNSKDTTPATVLFSGASSSDSDGINTYAWDFNTDGSTDSTELNPSFTYTTAGIYTVKLTVTDKGTPTLTGITTRQITVLTPTVTAQYGSIEVSSSPIGAKVYVDSEYKGLTPITITYVDPGTHSVELQMSGYNDRTKTVVVTAGKTSEVFFTLEVLAGTTTPTWITTATTIKQNDGKGKISISSQPSGAQVYVDNLVKGRTPCLIEDVSIGKHTIFVEMQGYTPWSMEVDVNSDSTLALSAFLNAITTATPPAKVSLNILSVLGALFAVSIIFALKWRKP